MPKVFDIIEGSERVPVIELTRRFGLDLSGIVLFGYDFHTLDDPNSDWLVTYKSIRTSVIQSLVLPLSYYDHLLRWFIPGRRQQLNDIQKLHDLLFNIADRKRAEYEANTELRTRPESEKTLLDLMIENDMQSGGTPESAALIKV